MPPLIRAVLRILLEISMLNKTFRPMEVRTSSSWACCGDASASDSEIRLGGWFGDPETPKSEVSWFCASLDPQRHPWAFYGANLHAGIFCTDMLCPLILMDAIARTYPDTLADATINVRSDSLSAAVSIIKWCSKSLPGCCMFSLSL